MTWYKCGGGGSEGLKPISLLNNYKIGISATVVKQNPIDANNYIVVSGNTITLKRNGNGIGLWIFTPELKANTVYALSFDTVTNTDGSIYFDYAGVVVSTGDISVTRLGSVSFTQLSSYGRGFAFKTTDAGQYGFTLWSGNVNDIALTNPLLAEMTSDI